MLGVNNEAISTLASMIDRETPRAESMKQSLQAGNQSLRGRNIISLISHVSFGQTDYEKISQSIY